MEWDEVFALLTVGATAPYAIELAANWIKSGWHAGHHHTDTKTQG